MIKARQVQVEHANVGSLLAQLTAEHLPKKYPEPPVTRTVFTVSDYTNVKKITGSTCVLRQVHDRTAKSSTNSLLVPATFLMWPLGYAA